VEVRKGEKLLDEIAQEIEEMMMLKVSAVRVSVSLTDNKELLMIR